MQALGHVFQAIVDVLRNLFVARIVDVFKAAGDTRHREFKGLQRFIGTLFGALKTLRDLVEMGLKIIDGRLMTFLIVFFGDSTQSGVDRLPADIGNGLLHLFQPLGQRLHMVFGGAGACFGFFARFFCLVLVHPTGNVAQSAADIGQRVIRAAFGCLKVIDHRIDGFFKRLQLGFVLVGALAVKAAAPAFGLFEPFGQLLDFTFKRIVMMGIGHGVVHVAFGTIEPLGQKSDRLFHTARQIKRASLALFNAGNDIAHGLCDRREVNSNTFSLRSLWAHLWLGL